MFWGTVLFLFLINSTKVVLAARWKLAFNIHASDGHNFGYSQNAWEDDLNVGSDKRAFTADYKNYDATLKIANYIAIVRHQKGVCDAAKVWKFLSPGKTLEEYLDSKKSSRLQPTSANHIWEYKSPEMMSGKYDPIFSVNGKLVFNWLYRDNGVRIGVSGNYRGRGALTASINDDTFVGLGNSFALDHQYYGWYEQDVGVYKDYEHLGSQGTDHGSSLKDGMLLGQYAIYISDAAETFPCSDKHRQLQIELAETTLAPTIAPTTFTHFKFGLADRNGDGYLNYAETAFDIADINKDGFLSFDEFQDSLQVAKGE